MGRIIRDYAEGDEITTLVKELTQEAINLFEGSAGNTGPSQFTDVHAAKEVLGTEGTVASGRMSLTLPSRCSGGTSGRKCSTIPESWTSGF